MEEKYSPEIGEESSGKGIHLPNPIRPGPCGPRGCPPPREIVCIKTKKVYQECRQVEPVERVKVYDLDIPSGAADVECVSITPGVISCEDAHSAWRSGKKPCPCECEVDEGTVTLEEIRNFPVRITVEFFDRNGLSLGRQTGWAKIDVEEKTVLLSRAGEPQLKCEVDIFLTCLLCHIEEEECTTPGESEGPRHSPVRRAVICCVNKVIVFKLIAEVQLLIPAYGFCPEPPECEEEVLGECPGAEELWPPYPPQNDSDGGCKGCR